ncbi:MAG: virulence factor [Candidatus Latescibacterota bacterium]|nr:virulence factor [Candidatus Latescibacterota bacterium]
MVYKILFWREIPAQLKIFDGRRPVSHQLDKKFQISIDRIAMNEGLMDDDSYLEHWNWSKKEEFLGTLDELIKKIEYEGDEAIKNLRTRNENLR